LVAAGVVAPVFANHQTALVIERALSGASSEPARGGSVLDQEGDLLQEGDHGSTGMPPPEHFQDITPMCGDGVSMEWPDAYLHMKDYTGATFEVCYMLASDEGAGNIGPFAEGRSRS
jgi:hypothetical protein